MPPHVSSKPRRGLSRAPAPTQPAGRWYRVVGDGAPDVPFLDFAQTKKEHRTSDALLYNRYSLFLEAVFERHRTVKNKVVRCAVFVGAEIAKPHKLVAVPRFGIGERRFQFAPFKGFERIGI